MKTHRSKIRIAFTCISVIFSSIVLGCLTFYEALTVITSFSLVIGLICGAMVGVWSQTRKIALMLGSVIMSLPIRSWFDLLKGQLWYRQQMSWQTQTPFHLWNFIIPLLALFACAVAGAIAGFEIKKLFVRV